ncbi:MAG: clostripain-related cysteine peptidase [Elusimicrobiales bacterium]
MRRTTCLCILSLGISAPASAAASALAELERIAPPRQAASPAASAEAKPQMKEWTIMVYAGYPPLESNLLYRVMEGTGHAGTTSKVNMVLQASYPSGGASRYLMEHTDSSNPFHSPALARFDKLDFGDYRNVTDFVRWARREFPARHYALILHGHGSGWVEGRSRMLGMLYGSGSGHVRNTELRKILEDSGRVDMLMLLSCAMQMAEVAYETGGHAGIIFGTEEIATPPENVYAALGGFVEAQPDAPAAAIAAAVLASVKKEFEELYWPDKHMDLGETFSAIDGAKAVELAAMLKDWSQAVMRAGEREAVSYAVNNVLRFGMAGYGSLEPDLRRDYAHFGDLCHFARLVGERAKGGEVKAKSAELERFISQELVIGRLGLFQRKHGDYGANALGISIEIPPRRQNPVPPDTEAGYAQSGAFARDSGWAEFTGWMNGFLTRPNSLKVSDQPENFSWPRDSAKNRFILPSQNYPFVPWSTRG